MKACRRCKRVLSASSFPRDSARPDGRARLCRSCQSSRYRAWYAAKRLDEQWMAHRRQRMIEARKRHEPRMRRRRFLRRLRLYGLTVRQYRQMLHSQQHACAICLRRLPLVIDHEHKSGMARGLLCGNCNRGLGAFGEDPQRLRAAVEYLKRTTPEPIVDQQR